MSSKLNSILALAARFQALAEQKYDLNFRNQVIHTRPDAKNFAFSEVANVVLQDLTSLDREEKDPAITQASHAIMNILNSFAVPDPQALLDAANQSAAVIKQKAPEDAKKVQVANYFANLAQLLVKKFYQSAQEDQAGEQASEGTVGLLQRLYSQLRQQQSLSSNDIAKWNAGKNLYMRRLQALNAMGQRTPQQEQERAVLQFVFDRLKRQVG